MPRDLRLPPVRVWLLGCDTEVAVLVWDDVPLEPVKCEAGPEDESGRGLWLIEKLSREW